MVLESNNCTFVHDFDAADSSTFLIGAGVSKSAPSNAPLWNELQVDLLELVARQASRLTAEQPLLRLAQSLAVLLKCGGVTPEQTLAILEANIGNEPLIGYLSSRLDCGASNRNHFKIAALSKKGQVSAIVTTNFDRYLEGALERLAVPFKVASTDVEKSALLREVEENRHHLRFVPVVKLHGTIQESDAVSTLYAQTVRRIVNSEEGRRVGLVAFAARSSLIFSKDAAGRKLHSANEEWLAFVCRRPLKVIGYSGNDRDIWPAVFENLIAGGNVVWGVMPGECPERVRAAASQMSDRMQIFEGDAYEFLSKIDPSPLPDELAQPPVAAKTEDWDQDFRESAPSWSCLEGIAALASALGQDAIQGLEEVCNTLSPDCPPLVRAGCYRALGVAKADVDIDGARHAFNSAIEDIRNEGVRDPYQAPVCDGLIGAIEMSLGRIAMIQGEMEVAIGHLTTALAKMESGDHPFTTLGEPEHEVVFRKACRLLALALFVLDHFEEVVVVANKGLGGADVFPDSAIQASLRFLRSHASFALSAGPVPDTSDITRLAPQDRSDMVRFFVGYATTWQRRSEGGSSGRVNEEMLTWAAKLYQLLYFVALNERVTEESPQLIVDVLMHAALIQITLHRYDEGLICLKAAREFCRVRSFSQHQQAVEKAIDTIMRKNGA